MFVEAPKPLSTRLDGTVSSIILGVAQINTPQAIPKTHRPKHTIHMFGKKLKRVPISPIMLNYITVDRLPFLTKSPPNIDPIAIPATAEVANRVTS